MGRLKTMLYMPEEQFYEAYKKLVLHRENLLLYLIPYSDEPLPELSTIEELRQRGRQNAGESFSDPIEKILRELLPEGIGMVKDFAMKIISSDHPIYIEPYSQNIFELLYVYFQNLEAEFPGLLNENKLPDKPEDLAQQIRDINSLMSKIYVFSDATAVKSREAFLETYAKRSPDELRVRCHDILSQILTLLEGPEALSNEVTPRFSIKTSKISEHLANPWRSRELAQSQKI